MKLIEITAAYPFLSGETFITHELDVAKDFFDEIVIIPLTSHYDTATCRRIPSNARVIKARNSKIEFTILLHSFQKMFRTKTWKEVWFAKKKLSVRENVFEILKRILLCYYFEDILHRVMKKLTIDTEDIFYSYWLAGSAYFLANSRLRNLKISRAHRFDCFIAECYQPFRREILDDLDLVVSISEAGKKDIEEKLMIFTQNSGDKVIVSRLGIHREDSYVDLRARSKDHITIITCSNVNSVKRLDILVDALRDIDIRVRWIHIGDGPLMGQITAMAQELKNNESVQYEFLGRLTQEEIYSYYKENHVDIFINCSDSEGIPVSIMEALSFGIPVIARDVGGNSEIVDATDGILLKKAIDRLDLQNAIKQIWSLSDGEYIRLRKGARAQYETKYTSHGNYCNFYECILKKSEEKMHVY